MEGIAFAIGLDPILTRGQHLVDQFRTWRDNKQKAPHLFNSFNSFEEELSNCIPLLQFEASKLPQQSRNLIENDVKTLKTCLIDTRTVLQSINRRLGRSSILQIFRANAVAKDCNILETKLQEARAFINSTEKHADLRSAVHRIEMRQTQTAVDRFREFFPPPSSRVQAVLDFDVTDEANNPRTTEGLVKRYLLKNTNDASGVVALHGIGGVGKSTILQALSVDNDIRQRFPDGVHLIKLGKDASFMTLFRQLCQVLKDSGAEKTYQSLSLQNDIDAVLHFFGSWFDKKTCAFLIDDVWTHRISLNLLSRVSNIGSEVSGNRVLITTREYEVASVAPSERIVELKPREVRGRVSRRILLQHAGHQETNPRTPSFHDSMYGILDICDGLPVSLAVAGKNVKKLDMGMPNDKDDVWKRYLSQLVICRQKLLRQDVGIYENLFATLATSITYLDEKSQEATLGFASRLSFAKMYRRFCVLEKQAVVPISMLKHLWNAESDECAQVIATAFVEAGLASRAATRVARDYDHLSLHDSLHDFAVAEAKRSGDTKDAHNCLLNSYNSCGRQIPCEWWSPEFEADGYIHRNVCRHLIEAGRASELLELLLSPQWVRRQLEVNDILSLQADFALGMKSIQARLTDETDEKHKDIERALELISDAAVLSSTFISSNRMELSFQLHGRLKGCAKIYRAIDDYVCRIKADGTRPRILCKRSCLREVGGSSSKIISIGNGVWCIAMLNDEKRIACGCRDGRIFVVNVKRKEIERQWKAHKSCVTAIVAWNDGTRLISASDDNTARVWEVETDPCVTSFTDHSDVVIDISVMKDERRVISVSRDGTCNVWDIETGEILSQLLTARDDSILCVAVLEHNEDLAVTGGSDGRLRIWNTTTGAQVGGTFAGYDEPIYCVAVTPDGEHIASGSRDPTVKVWNVMSRQQIGNSLEGHTRSVECLAVSEDGRRLVSGSHDATIRVWDLESRTQIHGPLEGHTDWVTGVAFLDGADVIVSSSEDGTLRVWNVTRINSKNLTNRQEWPVSREVLNLVGETTVQDDIALSIPLWGREILYGEGPSATVLATLKSSIESWALSPDREMICVGMYDGHVGFLKLET